MKEEIKCQIYSCEELATVTVTTISNHTSSYCDQHSPKMGSVTKAAIDKGRIPAPKKL